MAGLSIEEIESYLKQHAKDVGREFGMFAIESLGNSKSRVRLLTEKQHLRPGGTVSGPTLMHLTDAATYFAILGQIGPVWGAVTANLNINFLRRPIAKDIVAEVELLKVGRKLVFAEFHLYSCGLEDPVAHGTCTYALPSDAPHQ